MPRGLPSPPAARLAGGGPPAAAPCASSAASTQPPAPPPARPQQRGKSRRGAFERCRGAALPAPAHPLRPPARPGAAAGSRHPVLGTWASPAAGAGGRASAGKRAPRAGGRPAEPSRAGNTGHASCHGRLGSAQAPVPAPAPSGGPAPSLPLCPSPGPLLAQPSPACVSRAFPTLQLAGLYVNAAINPAPRPSRASGTAGQAVPGTGAPPAPGPHGAARRGRVWHPAPSTTRGHGQLPVLVLRGRWTHGMREPCCYPQPWAWDSGFRSSCSQDLAPVLSHQQGCPSPLWMLGGTRVCLVATTLGKGNAKSMAQPCPHTLRCCATPR